MTFLRQRGGYRSLVAFQIAQIIYDITAYFVGRFLSRGDRTVDQMLQAARSGKQNIAEGSAASTTSRETEIKLTNVARASLEELMLDYEDYLRTRGLAKWDASHPRFAAMRAYARSDAFRADCMRSLPRMGDEEICNLQLTLIHQASLMLWRLIEVQQEQFLAEGGVREAMAAARREARRGGRQ